MQIEAITRVDDELDEAFQRLIPQLTSNNPPPSLDHLAALVHGAGSTLLAARNEAGQIIGTLTLTIYRVPTGTRAIIEDVIVDISARGLGIGEALMTRAIEIAREKGAGNISLTSNTGRVAANRLYVKLGFEKRDTNIYRLLF